MIPINTLLQAPSGHGVRIGIPRGNHVLILTILFVVLLLAPTFPSGLKASGDRASADSQALFSEAYPSSSWSQVGSEISVVSPGTIYFNYAWGQGATFTQERVYKQLPSVLPAAWTTNFNYNFTQSSNSAGYPPDTFVLALTPTSQDPELPYPQGLGSNGIAIQHTDDALQISYPSASSSITISVNTQYYVSLVKTPTEIQLSVFSNPTRTVQVAGSPVSITISPTSLSNLDYIQHSGCLICGYARALTAYISGLSILGLGSTLFQETYPSGNWNQVGAQVSMVGPGDAFFNYVWGQGATFTQERVYHQLPSTLPDSWIADFAYNFSSSSTPSGYAPDMRIFALTPTSRDPSYYYQSPANEVVVEDTSDSLAIAAPSSSPAISISLNTQYYVALNRTATQLQLSVFSDPGRTVQVPGSPVSIQLSAGALANLTYLQYGGCVECGYARALTGYIADTTILVQGTDFFQSSYPSTNWSRAGDGISMISPGDAFFNYAWGQGATFTQERVYQKLPSVLPSTWTANFDYNFTYSTSSSGYAPDTFIFALTPTSQDPELPYPQGVGPNGVAIQHTNDELQISYPSASAAISVSINTQYYVSLAKTPTELQLSVFSDSARTDQIAGSPVSIPLSSGALSNLDYIQHSGCLICGYARALTAYISDLAIYSGATIVTSSSTSSSTTNTTTSSTSSTTTTTAVSDPSGIALTEMMSTSGAVSSPSYQITLSNFNAGTGSDRLLVVGVSADDNNVASITFGNASLTQAVSSFYNNDAEFWYLTNPNGTANIVVTMAGETSVVVGGYALSGVDQIDPIPTTASNYSTASSSPSISITTRYAGSWVLDLPSIYGGSTLGSSTGTQQWNLNVPNAITGASSSTVSSAPGQVTCGWTASASDLWDDVAVEVMAAG
jgi:hypothetical protein